MLERAAGGIVYQTASDGQRRILLIQDKYGIWTLPKGHLEGDETPAQAAEREIAEETGVRCVIGRLVDRAAYPVFKKGRWRDKEVDYFLAAALTTTLTPALEEGIAAAGWFTCSEALPLIGYDQVRVIVRCAVAMLDGGSCEE
jgi:ADP-ribose pyrophosphatase YjhB (NUDIX family)